jgi:hypothetical protein
MAMEKGSLDKLTGCCLLAAHCLTISKRHLPAEIIHDSDTGDNILTIHPEPKENRGISYQ